jgi:hypothetical protein
LSPQMAGQSAGHATADSVSEQTPSPQRTSSSSPSGFVPHAATSKTTDIQTTAAARRMESPAKKCEDDHTERATYPATR